MREDVGYRDGPASLMSRILFLIFTKTSIFDLIFLLGQLNSISMMQAYLNNGLTWERTYGRTKSLDNNGVVIF